MIEITGNTYMAERRDDFSHDFPLVPQTHGELVLELARVRAQRDRLAAACAAALDWVRPHGGDSQEQHDTYRQLCAALAAVEGGG